MENWERGNVAEFTQDVIENGIRIIMAFTRVYVLDVDNTTPPTRLLLEFE
jgi:hypothetical protein|tara:strand:- start:142 stop:291 length:150 start_codon:yes stop_codon:yes gene_type:complete